MTLDVVSELIISLKFVLKLIADSVTTLSSDWDWTQFIPAVKVPHQINPKYSFPVFLKSVCHCSFFWLQVFSGVRRAKQYLNVSLSSDPQFTKCMSVQKKNAKGKERIFFAEGFYVLFP